MPSENFVCFHHPKVKLKPKQSSFVRGRKKPQWVVDAVLRLKAQAPELSVRAITEAFNLSYRQASVGKTFVGYTLKDHAHEVLQLRKKFKNKPPYPVKFNQTWGIDLTFVQQQPILGIVEHHSRKAVGLIPLKDKATVTILLGLLSVLTKHPKPKFIRTDNEQCFKSWLFKFVLWTLGIKHQTTQICHPWQNGRVERFFGTFKTALGQLPPHQSDLLFLCQSFAFWYNHVRPHQNLMGQTPEMIYNQRIAEQSRKQRRHDE